MAIRPRNLSGCCLHGVCTSGICFAETLLAEAGVEKTPSQWNGVLVSKRRSLVSKKGKNTSQTGKQFRKYFYCFCLAEALLAEAEVEKTPFEILFQYWNRIKLIVNEFVLWLWLFYPFITFSISKFLNSTPIVQVSKSQNTFNQMKFWFVFYHNYAKKWWPACTLPSNFKIGNSTWEIHFLLLLIKNMWNMITATLTIIFFVCFEQTT